MLDNEGLSVQDLNNSGVSLCVDGDFEAGIPLLRKAQAARPDDPDLCCSLGNALALAGSIPEAVTYLKRAIEIDPNHVAANAILESLIDLKPLAGSVRKAERRTKSTQRIPWLLLFAFLLLGVFAGYATWKPLWPQHVHHFTRQGARSTLFRVEQTVADTPTDRSDFLKNGWNPPVAFTDPDSVRNVSTYYQVTSTNLDGDYVGVRSEDNKLTGFLDKGGQLIDLAPLQTDNESVALSINNYGTIAGYSGTVVHHAVLWAGGKVLDLAADTTLPVGLVLKEAVEVDDNGSVIATAVDPSGNALLVELTTN